MNNNVFIPEFIQTFPIINSSGISSIIDPTKVSNKIIFHYLNLNLAHD